MTSRDLLRDLGVRPVVNAAGTYTFLTASIMPPEVRAAWEATADVYVRLDELHDAVGARIATLIGAEASMITSGAAAALTLATAACMTGADEDRIRRLPDATGMPDEVIIQRSHRVVYDHAIRACGVRLVEVETADELERAAGAQTAMLFYLNHATSTGLIGPDVFVAIGRRLGIPTLIDCAGDVPPVENLTRFFGVGFDLVAFSGGKGLLGPQSTGLLAGRGDLVAAARRNGPPNADTIGRSMKVNKEELVALLVAVERYLARDHAADWREWERRVEVIAAALAGIEGVTTEPFLPAVASRVPHLRVRWIERPGRTRGQIRALLRDGEPSIELVPEAVAGPDGLEVGVWMLAPGEEEVVARRLAEVLRGSVR